MACPRPRPRGDGRAQPAPPPTASTPWRSASPGPRLQARPATSATGIASAGMPNGKGNKPMCSALAGIVARAAMSAATA
eukprot:1157361-Alexandrium_andersonii.AAC.1